MIRELKLKILKWILSSLAVDSNYIKHAKREFIAIGYSSIDECEDDPNKWIQEGVIQLLQLFSLHGHSGSSAPYANSYFEKLSLFKPLSPLTGEDYEWNKIGDNKYQNNRCSHVFKDDDRAYDINGKIFREPNGCCYTNSDSFVDITFPYTPVSEYVDRPS